MIDNPAEPAHYHFQSAKEPHTAQYLHEPILEICRRLKAQRILDLGCGNGAFAGKLSRAGFEVAGCDPSTEGIEIAKHSYPGIHFYRLGVYDDPVILGTDFDVVVSTEVIEHLHSPRMLPRFAAKVLRNSGHLIVTTPYHGYLKNLTLAVTGKMDFHFRALSDGGHIKFWSRRTLTSLLSDEGFQVENFIGSGRFPFLWKSMILVAKKVIINSH